MSDFVIENGLLISYKGNGGDVVIPDEVTKIGMRAFARCNTITSIVIPDSVTSIGLEAFEGCSSFTNIVINALGIEKHFLFRNFPDLKKLVLPEGITVIKREAFKGLEHLEEVNIPETVTNIGEKAFYGCSALTEITIPEWVEFVGAEAFYGCSGLQSISVPVNFEKNLDKLLDSVPETVIVSVGCINSLPKEFRISAIRGALHTWKQGGMTVRDQDDLALIIGKDVKNVFKALADYLPLYEFMTTVGKLPKFGFGKLVKLTTDAKCRELLLNYKGK